MSTLYERLRQMEQDCREICSHDEANDLFDAARHVKTVDIIVKYGLCLMREVGGNEWWCETNNFHVNRELIEATTQPSPYEASVIAEQIILRYIAKHRPHLTEDQLLDATIEDVL